MSFRIEDYLPDLKRLPADTLLAWIISMIGALIGTWWAATVESAPKITSVGWLIVFVLLAFALMLLSAACAWLFFWIRSQFAQARRLRVGPPILSQPPEKPGPPLEQPASAIKLIEPIRPISEEDVRESLLRRRRELEKLALGAKGTRVVIEFGEGNIKNIEIVSDRNKYSIAVSQNNGTALWVYAQDGSMRSIASVPQSIQRGGLIDVRTLRPVKGGALPIVIGQRAVAITADGAMIQILLTGVQDYNSGDDTDEARFKYVLYPAGEFLVPAM